jgi:hypothetical protein
MERTLNDLYFEEKEVLIEKKKEDMRVQVWPQTQTLQLNCISTLNCWQNLSNLHAYFHLVI